MLAAHTGTVQLVLSLYFNDPVEVTLLEQSEAPGRIERRVALTRRLGGARVALAESVIPIDQNQDQVLEAVRKGELGLGQILAKYGLPVRRELTGLEVDRKSLQRRYTIQGPGVHYQIQEEFPSEFYR